MKAYEEISLEDRLLADKFCDDVLPFVQRRTIIVVSNPNVGLSARLYEHFTT